MKTIKNNLPAIISIMMFGVFSALTLMLRNLFDTDFSRAIVLACIGAVTVAITAFAKEKHIHSFGSISYILISAILCYQLLTDDGYSYNRYVDIFGYIVIESAALLPIMKLTVADKINYFNKPTIGQFFKICLYMLVPAFAVWMQPNSKYAIMAIAVLFIVALTMSIKKRVKIHPALFTLPVVASAGAFWYSYNNSYYIKDRLEVILTRGQSDPLGAGWMRTVMDSIITSAPFSGNAQIMGEPWSESGVYMNIRWYDNQLLWLIGDYGWLGFILTLAAYAVFFICLFRMVKATKQSTFARYASFSLALTLLVQAISSVICLFLLDACYIDMPFMGTGMTNRFVNCLIFGIILALYFRRNAESEVADDTYDPEKHFSLYKKVQEFFKEDDEDAFADDYSDMNFEYALLFGDKLIKTLEEIEETDLEKYSPQLAQSYFHLAKICATNEEYTEEASIYFTKAAVIYERLYMNDPDEYFSILSLCYNKAGNFYLDVEDYEKGEQLLLEAIRLAELHNDTYGFSAKRRLVGYYHDMGYFYEMQENYGNAAKYYNIVIDKLREFADESPDEFMYELADAHLHIANFFKRQKKYSKAQEYYHNATEIYLKMVETDMLYEVYIELKASYRLEAECALNQLEFKKAIELYKLAAKVKEPYI